MKYIISTLGCKVNQYETQAIETILKSRGHVSGTPADCVIINTCAVTAESGRKSRQLIRKLKEENPSAIVAVCGCYSQLSPEEAEATGADIIFGTNDKQKLVDAIERGVSGSCIDDPFRRREYELLPAGAVSGRTRAMLKIQDGCVNFCTYCIIPYTRGRLRSLPFDEAVKETEKIASEGYRELVLTGIEVASYGADLPGRPGLADVVNVCASAAGDMRIRLGSLEPTIITEEFCEKLSASGKICRQFHLSLQSGCDRTLKAMNRKYDTKRYLESCRLLRKHFPGCAITCDLITGFPGETDEDFEKTLEFIRECSFSAMHIFPYSRRPGTPADSFPNQCTKAVKEKRLHMAQDVSREMRREFMEKCVGGILPVLFETEENGFCTGHSDTYILVRVEGTKLRNSLLDVKITGTDGYLLTGVLLNR